MGIQFFSGSHPAEHKETTRRKPVALPDRPPEHVTLALRGRACLVKPGQRVFLGEPIARPEREEDVVLHASVSGINNKRICSHRTVSAHGGIARKDNKRRCREDRNGRKHRRHLNKAFKLNRNKHIITPLTNYVRGVIIISFGYEFFKAVKALFDILH